MFTVGFVGWRGMVGSVLLKRMIEDGDFKNINPIFFSTSQILHTGPQLGKKKIILHDAFDIDALTAMDIIVSCHGSNYTNIVYKKLIKNKWKGYWLDASSTLRMNNDAVIVLDPINSNLIYKYIDMGIKTFIGGNCIVSIMLMTLGGLFKAKIIEWINSITYQAASGAGSQYMRELINQMYNISNIVYKDFNSVDYKILDIDKKLNRVMYSGILQTKKINLPIAVSLLPWIDQQINNGQSREEWKSNIETNKILGYLQNTITIDGICVRIGTMRCHSQALIIKLRKNIPINDIETIINEHNDWVNIVPNNKKASIEYLTPASVSGNIKLLIGRMRQLIIGDEYLTAFSVGDQLIWGAAEPIKRMLNIIINYI